MSKSIVVSSGGQSGSTMLFNIFRYCYEEFNLQFDSMYISGRTNKMNDIIRKWKKHRKNGLIIKTHSKLFTEPCVSDYIFFITRDLRDSAISSYNRYKNTERSDLNSFINNMEHNINAFKNWKSEAHVLKYEDIMNNKYNSVEKILKIIGFINHDECYKEKIKRSIFNIVKKSDNDLMTKSENQNPDTLLSSSHITSNGQSKKYTTFFTKDENRIILENDNIRNYLDEHKYL
tara:strand:- start:23874 stop:24569 length:696 start_codon:yes stop_codon:yes gene_type:complete